MVAQSPLDLLNGPTKSQQPVYSQRPAFRLVENNDRFSFFPHEEHIVRLDERLAKGTNLCCKIMIRSITIEMASQVLSTSL